MARPQNFDPLIYRPMRRNLSRAKNKGEKAYKKYLRGCGDNYISRVEVRNYVFQEDNYKCVLCGSKEELQVDHITSVYKGWKSDIQLEVINSLDNLQTLCKPCNAGKLT